MTVTLNSSVSSAISLCDGATLAGTPGKFIGPLGDGVTEAQWQVQLAQALRAPAATPFDRLNAEHSFNFQVFVEFATDALATAFRLGWIATLPRTGAWLLVAYEGTTQIATYNPAVLKSCRIAQNGVSCLVDYQFKTAAPVIGS